MVPLHLHSYYTKLKSTLTVDDLIDYANNNGFEALALTDTNGMYGLIQFAQKCTAAGIKPLLGTLIDLESEPDTYAVFIAKNNAGYSEICRIITNRKLQENFSLKEVVQNASDNVYILTASLNLLKELDFNERLKQNLYCELIVTGRQKKNTRELYKFAEKNGLKFVATNPGYFKTKADFNLHKIVTAIRLNKNITSLEETELVDEEYYLRSKDELYKIWAKLPEAIINTDRIAANCNADLEIGKIKQPRFMLPENETAYSLLHKRCYEGLYKKYNPVSEAAQKRLNYELEVINELDFVDYFLIVHDIIAEARRRNMMTIGRGSAANSLVAYCLDITQVDPVRYNLYFERFLNKARTSPPDIDIDFSWKERDELVKYVFDKYGYDRVAMISTTITFRARSAFRETAKVFGIAESEISRYSKLIPWTSAANLPVIAEKFPETKSLQFNSEPWKTIIKEASRLAGFPRHSSIHPGGIVVSPEPMTNYLALEFAKNKGLGLIITQPDMYPIEDLGLIKIDLLSQRSLGVLRDTMNRLAEEDD